MSDDFVVNVRQIGQYPIKPVPQPTDLFLIQEGGLGGAYRTIQYRSFWTGVPGMALGILPPPICKGLVSGFTTTPIGTRQGFNWYVDIGGNMRFLQNGYAGLWSFGDYELSFSVTNIGFKDDIIPIPPIPVFQLGLSGQMKIAGQLEVARVPVRDNEVVTLEFLKRNVVWSFDQMQASDIYRALKYDPCDPLATVGWVNGAICDAFQAWYYNTPLVFSFNGRVGTITLTDADITAACTAAGAMAQTNTPPPGDYSYRIANTMFVGDAVEDLKNLLEAEIGDAISGAYAPLNSPQFTGIPTAPTANPGTTTGQLATTAFVQAAVTESTTGVASFNTRTGAIILEASDINSAGGALLNSPQFTGVPTAPTPTAGTNTNEIATCAFVEAALAAFVPTTGVQTFNTRTGAVTLTTADVTGAGGAPLSNPAFQGVPTAATAAPNTNTNQLATTAFVINAITNLGTGVASWNGRVGAVTLQANDVSAVGGALINNPSFTGNPQAPTQNPGTNNTTIATTAFVAQAVSGVNLGVTSFNTRTGAITLNSTDITSAGGAVLASPAFSGAPTSPTPAQTSNDNTLATTAFVKAALAGASVVATFNGRSGAVTLAAADISAAGGALIAGPAFTGVPTAPTAALNTNTTQLATTAFVISQLSVAGGVSSFNSRAGNVVLNTADVVATNALPLASGFINKFRNGTMCVMQRAVPVNAAAGVSTYALDGWQVTPTGAAVSCSQQYNVNIGGFAMRLTGAAGVTGVTMMGKIEGSIAAQLLTRAKATQPVTVQFTIYNGTAAAITPQVSTAFATAQDNFTATTADLAATNLQSIAAGAMGTVAYTFNPSPSAALGYVVTLSFGGALNAAGAFVDISDADIRATPGAALGLNASPPLPELVDVGVEMRRCTRYYQSIANVQHGAFTQAGQINYVPIVFATMRVQPTANMGMNSPSGGATNWAWAVLSNNCARGSMTQGGTDGTLYGYWSGALSAEL